jgi:DNA-binding NarL/FixJ family response regulator
MIGIVLGSPEPAFRRALGTELGRHRELEVVGDTGTPACLTLLVASLRPSLLVIEACWAQACPDLLSRLLARPAPPRILLYADALARPEVVAAVKQGVHGCLPRDSQPATWYRAILAVHAGEPWIPRWLMAEALTDMKRLLQSGPPAAANMEKLTERQREIVSWAAQGLSNKEIGRRLGISPTTVKTHLQNIFERVGISGRRQLALHALGSMNGMESTITTTAADTAYTGR